jgi:hypothetical protein
MRRAAFVTVLALVPTVQRTSPPAPAPLRVLRTTAVRATAGGEPRATLNAGALVEVIERESGWVRVRLDGWVQERDLTDSASAAQLSAADLRANPGMHRGKIVHWELEIIALQRADPLRKGLTPDEPYVIARGPAGENAIIYAAVPPELLDEVRSLPPLASVAVTARVRDGRSAPTGVPVLELVSLTRRP